MHALLRTTARALMPLVLAAGLPCRAEAAGASARAPVPAPVEENADDVGSVVVHVGAVALGAALGAATGFSLGAAVAGGAYPLVRREPPPLEGLAVGIGTPVALTLFGAGAGALLAPLVLGEPVSVAGGLGATGGAAVAGVAAAVPGAYLTWEATKSLGAAFEEPSPEGCILSLVGLSASLSLMFGGFCAGATCGGAAGGAGGALFDGPGEEQALPPAPPLVPSIDPAPPAPVAY